MNNQREPCLAVHFCTTTKGQRMKHILLTRWGISNLFSCLFCTKIDCVLGFKTSYWKSAALIYLAFAFNYAFLSTQPNPTWPCSVTSMSNQYRCLNLAHSRLLHSADLIELSLTSQHTRFTAFEHSTVPSMLAITLAVVESNHIYYEKVQKMVFNEVLKLQHLDNPLYWKYENVVELILFNWAWNIRKKT